MAAQVLNTVERMADGFTDPFYSLIRCHYLPLSASLLLADGARNWPCALYPSVLMCQRVHRCFGYTKWICVCMPPEDDLQSIDLEAHTLEHNKNRCLCSGGECSLSWGAASCFRAM